MAAAKKTVESQKTRLELMTDDDPVTWVHVIELTDVPIPTGEVNTANTTTLDDDFERTEPTGVIKYGAAEYKGLVIGGADGHLALHAAFLARTRVTVRVVTTDRRAHVFDAVVTKWGKEVKSGDKLRLSFTLNPDGGVTEVLLP